MSLFVKLLPTLISIAKDAFSKDNVKKSPTTALAALIAPLGGYSLMTYKTDEEALVSVVLVILSVVLFFLNERKGKETGS